MSRTLFLALALLACVCSVAAHAGHNRGGMPYGWKEKRQSVVASTCSAYQCSVAGGSCDVTQNRYCPGGQYCGAGTCAPKSALGSACTVDVNDNACAQGTCVASGGQSATCQYVRELLPGNVCSADSECKVMGTGTGSCSAGTCSGRAAGESCTPGDCLIGNFCRSDKVCMPLSGESSACASDSECAAPFTCASGICSRRYSRVENDPCTNNHHCGSGLYCSASKKCSKISTTASSKAACDLSNDACPTGEECTCNGYTTVGQTSTCQNIKGTYDNMFNIENAALDCLAKFGCNADTANTTNVQCIQKNCVASFCTYSTRFTNEMFADYPECVRSRMVESQSYASLLNVDCAPYVPKEEVIKPTTSSSSAISASVALISMAIFFLAF